MEDHICVDTMYGMCTLLLASHIKRIGYQPPKANPARGLLNWDKREKMIKSGSTSPPPSPPPAAININININISTTQETRSNKMIHKARTTKRTKRTDGQMGTGRYAGLGPSINMIASEQDYKVCMANDVHHDTHS